MNGSGGYGPRPSHQTTETESTVAEKPIYVKNPKGGVHSVSQEHYEALLEEDGTLPKNWAKLSEADAKKASPALFGLDENGNEVKTAEAASSTSRDEAADLLRELVAQLKGGK